MPIRADDLTPAIAPPGKTVRLAGRHD